MFRSLRREHAWRSRRKANEHLSFQAYRLITQVVFVGSRILGRAFTEAYRQANASSAYQRAQQRINPSGAGGAPSASGRANLATGMTLDEACRILNVRAPPKGGPTGGGAQHGEQATAQMEEVMERFKRLFDVNDPEKGGSFYLQSKVLRARERLEAELGPAVERQAAEEEARKGWQPKVYKDR